MIISLLIGAAQIAPATFDPAFAPAAASLNLLCDGTGEKQASQINSGQQWDNKTQKYRSKDTVDWYTKQFDADVTVQLGGNSGRIQIAKKLVPPINNGGDGGGWWTLADLMVTPDEIRASFKFNGLNRPKLQIDRRSGAITITGIDIDYTGRCDAVDPNARRF